MAGPQGQGTAGRLEDPALLDCPVILKWSGSDERPRGSSCLLGWQAETGVLTGEPLSLTFQRLPEEAHSSLRDPCLGSRYGSWSSRTRS